MRKLTSPANTGNPRRVHARLARPASVSRHAGLHGPGTGPGARRRSGGSAPGAMPQASCAASMAMVPAPQQGSNSGPSSARPCQPMAASIAAASVSFSGASPLASRQPRLNKASPERSAYNVASLGGRRTAPARQVGACRVSTLGRVRRCASRSASHHRVLHAQSGEVQALAAATGYALLTRSVCDPVLQRTRRPRSSARRGSGPDPVGHSTRRRGFPGSAPSRCVRRLPPTRRRAMPRCGPRARGFFGEQRLDSCSNTVTRLSRAGYIEPGGRFPAAIALPGHHGDTSRPLAKLRATCPMTPPRWRRAR